jgi:hypothetical protein
MSANWVDISSSLSLHEAFGTYLIPPSILRVLLVDNADMPHNMEFRVFLGVDKLARIDFAVYEHETPKIIEGV